MRAEKDPATLALMARYRNLPMPNLRLSDDNAEDLIAYIADESRKLSPAAAPAGHGAHVH